MGQIKGLLWIAIGVLLGNMAYDYAKKKGFLSTFGL